MNIIEVCRSFLDRYSIRILLFYAVLLFIVIPFTFSKIIAPDLFKALYTGRYMALFLEIPHHSQFTFSPVKEFFPAESFNWLVNLFFYGLYQIGGIPAAQLFRVFVAIFLVVMVHSMVRYRTNPLILLILMALLFGAKQKFLVRNALFLIPFSILLMWLWQQARLRQSKWWWLGFPVLFLFWGGMHGTYLVGLGLLGLMVSGDILDWFFRLNHPGLKHALRGFAVIILVLPIVIFAKPFPDYTVWDVGSGILERGGKGMVSSFYYGNDNGQNKDSDDDRGVTGNDREQTVANEDPDTGVQTASKRDSRSWQFNMYLKVRYFLQNTVFDTDRPSAAGKDFPLDPNRVFMFTTISIVLIIVTLGCFAVTARWFRFSEFLPFIAASIIGLGYIRTVALIPLIVIPILFMKFDRGDFEHVETGKVKEVMAVIVIGAFLFQIGYHLWYNNMSTFTNSYLDFGWGKADRFSDKVPNYVLEHYPDQRVYNRYVLGTYLIWNWWPDKKVFIDGKSLAYKADFIGEMIPNSHTEIADDQDLSLIIVPIIRTQPYRNLIPNPDWHVVGYDRGMMVFARAGTGSERQAKQSARDLMLYSDEEFQALPRDTRYLLKGVEGFIDFYHNKEDAQGDFSSPFERYDRHIKQLRQTINIPENMDIIRDS